MNSSRNLNGSSVEFRDVQSLKNQAIFGGRVRKESKWRGLQPAFLVRRCLLHGRKPMLPRRFRMLFDNVLSRLFWVRRFWDGILRDGSTTVLFGGFEYRIDGGL